MVSTYDTYPTISSVRESELQFTNFIGTFKYVKESKESASLTVGALISGKVFW
jgi:hypothetical protein